MPSGDWTRQTYKSNLLGFQSMFAEDDLLGRSKVYNTMFRKLSTDNPRWWSRDPLESSFPWKSPYMSMGANPVNLVDPLGLADKGLDIPAPNSVDPGGGGGDSGASPSSSTSDIGPIGSPPNSKGNSSFDWNTFMQMSGGSAGLDIEGISQAGNNIADNIEQRVDNFVEGAEERHERYEELTGEEPSIFGKTEDYLQSAMQSVGPYTDAEDFRVLLHGQRIDGIEADGIDYLFATVGAAIPVVSGSSLKNASRILGRNLEKTGVKHPANTAAHHIVAISHEDAEIARDILNANGIDINDAVNGVFLPRFEKFANPPAITHSTIHTNKYFQSLNNRLSNTSDVRKELELIKQEILEGTFPY